MVRAIVAYDGENVFYGTREAFYGIVLPNEKSVRNFANDLENIIYDANASEKPSGDSFLFLEKDGAGRIKAYPLDGSELSLDDALRDHGRNIHLICNPYEKTAATLISRSSQNDADNKWGLYICPIGIPNKIFWFNPQGLYDLGEKWGNLETGEDFDMTLKNYREINNR
jgi:hypothetical protein